MCWWNVDFYMLLRETQVKEMFHFSLLVYTLIIFRATGRKWIRSQNALGNGMEYPGPLTVHQGAANKHLNEPNSAHC